MPSSRSSPRTGTASQSGPVFRTDALRPENSDLPPGLVRFARPPQACVPIAAAGADDSPERPSQMPRRVLILNADDVSADYNRDRRTILIAMA
jgi:hypothetical protein